MRTITVIIGIVIVLVMTGICLSQEGEERVTSLFVLRNDWVSPKEGKSSVTQLNSGYWHFKSFGGGIDVKSNLQANFLEAQPYLTINSGPWYLLGGFSTNSAGADYIQTGLWYIKSFSKLTVIADLRNYWAVSEKANGYTDNLLEVTYPLTEKFFTGFDFRFDHWWKGKSHDWYLAGPLIGYNLTKSTSIFLRVSREWDVLDSRTSRADRIRIGLKLCF